MIEKISIYVKCLSVYMLEIKQVRRRKMEESEEEVYETELAQLFSEEDEVHVFFASLDEELNKVNQFYKKQETEFLERGEMLNRQLQILLDLKQLLADRRRKHPRPPPKAYSSDSFPPSPGKSSNFSGQFFLLINLFN